ncbi:MAG: rhomboid family intramembrane serine protease [Pararhizobium sp.]|nr:rhomboid family intramembrane serine protease [Pararhizobium sp.]MDO9415341.1 rhomboid family intramembrane serine protease [Pararhizobium sp.]
MSAEAVIGEEVARKREPAINLPGSLLVALLGLVAIHAVRVYLLAPETDNWLLVEFAFFPARYAFSLSEQSFAWLWSPVTYSLLHGGWEHVLFNAFWLVAFGAPVVRRIGTLRFILFWCISAAAAVAFHTAFHWGDAVPVIGASGVVAALMGAAARFVFSPGGRIRRESHLNPLMSIPAALSDRTVLVFAGVLFASNLLIGLGAFAPGGAATIAWEAHIGGFLFGFLFFAPFDRQPVPSE